MLFLTPKGSKMGLASYWKIPLEAYSWIMIQVSLSCELEKLCLQDIAMTYCKLVGCSLFSTDPPQKMQDSYLYSTYWIMQNLRCYIAHSQIASCLPLLPSSIQSLFVFPLSKLIRIFKGNHNFLAFIIFTINNTDPCYKLCVCPYVLTTFGKGDNYVYICG